MKISLITSTVNRVDELNSLLASLRNQKYKEFELILVDQNEDDRLSGLISEYSGELEIRRVKSERGVSRGRNAGISMVSGDIVGFPDDDCFYDKNTLDAVVKRMSECAEIDGILGRSVDPEDNASSWAHKKRPGPVTKRNVWKCGGTATTFLRRRLVTGVGNFDERIGLGAGTVWGGGADTEYLLRCLEGGSKLHYFPDLIVYHLNPSKVMDRAAFQRAYTYGRGMGYVLARYGYGFFYRIWFVLKPVLKMCFSAVSFKWRRVRWFSRSAGGRYRGLADGKRGRR